MRNTGDKRGSELPPEKSDTVLVQRLARRLGPGRARLVLEISESTLSAALARAQTRGTSLDTVLSEALERVG